MAQHINIETARTMRDALGKDLKWRLAYADDQRFVRGQQGHWHEDKSAQRRELQALDDQYSWHLRPMPLRGPFFLTMLDDATQETIDRVKAEGLPPTAVVKTSEDRYQVWHRWPTPMNREQTKELLTHLQSHFSTDPGANAPGHCGRLAGSRNWKRDPAKGIDRGGCLVVLTDTHPSLSKEQSAAWLGRNPIPKFERTPGVVPAGQAAQLDLEDPRYQKILSKGLQKLPEIWHETFRRTGNASGADMAIANRAVSLQLSDATAADILSGFVHREGRKAHGQGYISLTIAHARNHIGVMAPGVWSSKFDAVRQFPYLETQKSKSRERDPEAER